ncbi:MAG: hypothetical protein MUC50_12650 [Myxococcota bacterium]|nr:hypothetical protein [Myxococcota bacterium]
MTTDYRPTWKELGLDLEAHDALLGVLGAALRGECPSRAADRGRSGLRAPRHGGRELVEWQSSSSNPQPSAAAPPSCRPQALVGMFRPAGRGASHDLLRQRRHLVAEAQRGAGGDGAFP